MKLDVETVELKPYERFHGILHCQVTKENETAAQYEAMLDYLGFRPVKKTDTIAKYELQFPSQVENLKHRFIQFAKADYGKKYILD